MKFFIIGCWLKDFAIFLRHTKCWSRRELKYKKVGLWNWKDIYKKFQFFSPPNDILSFGLGCDQASNLILNNRICLEKQESSVERPEKTNEPTDLNIPQTLRTSVDKNQDVVESLRGSYNGATSMAATLRDWMTSFSSSLKGQSHTTLLLVIGIAAILLLMQVLVARMCLYLFVAPSNDTLWSESMYTPAHPTLPPKEVSYSFHLFNY